MLLLGDLLLLLGDLLLPLGDLKPLIWYASWVNLVLGVSPSILVWGGVSPSISVWGRVSPSIFNSTMAFFLVSASVFSTGSTEGCLEDGLVDCSKNMGGELMSLRVSWRNRAL